MQDDGKVVYVLENNVASTVTAYFWETVFQPLKKDPFDGIFNCIKHITEKLTQSTVLPSAPGEAHTPTSDRVSLGSVSTPCHLSTVSSITTSRTRCHHDDTQTHVNSLSCITCACFPLHQYNTKHQPDSLMLQRAPINPVGQSQAPVEGTHFPLFSHWHSLSQFGPYRPSPHTGDETKIDQSYDLVLFNSFHLLPLCNQMYLKGINEQIYVLWSHLGPW